MPSYYNETTKKWYCKFYYTDWKGQKKQKKKSGFPRKKDAVEWERIFLEQFSKEPDITFSSLYERYKEYISPRIRESTAVNRFSMLENHVLPFFKDRIVSDIGPADIAAWQTEMLKKGLSDTTLRQVNTYLKTVFSYGVDYVGLSKNPCRKSIGSTKTRKLNFWTPDEYHCFIQQFDGEEKHKKRNIVYFTAFEILYYTGMRIGELLALTVQDVDFSGNKISINKTFYHTNRKDVINPPKTQAGERVIDIPEFLTEEIKEYLALLYEPSPDMPLFSDERRNIEKTIKLGAVAAGVKPIRVHDLRHSHASALINLGANPILVAERLGHESADITLKTYAHLFPHIQAEIVKKIKKV